MDGFEDSTGPRAKKQKRECHFVDSWMKEFQGIHRSSKGINYARCNLCSSDFSISHGGRHDVTTHVNGKHHKEMTRAVSASKSVSSHFRQQPQSVIEAET